MNYRAKHVDTDKAIEHIEYLIKKSYTDQAFKKQKIDEYYEGLRKGLDIAESLFECSNFEVDERKEELDE